MTVLTISDAARSIGHRSRSQIYRYMELGLLEAFVREGANGVRMLETDGLSDFIRSITRKHPRNAIKPCRKKPVNTSFWSDVAEHSNHYIDCSLWGPPPWSAEQWMVLFTALEHGVNEVEAQRKFDLLHWESLAAAENL